MKGLIKSTATVDSIVLTIIVLSGYAVAGRYINNRYKLLGLIIIS